jgi:hypothetical protein
VTPARRYLLAGLVVAAGELVLAAAARSTGLAPYLAATALATAALALATHRLLALPADPPGDGGTGKRPSGDPPPPPPWWPEFEEQFRRHVGERRPRIRS